MSASIKTAADYILGLFDPNDWVCVTLIRGKKGESKHQVIELFDTAKIVAGEEFLHQLEQHNKNGFNVYICMNPLSHGIKARSKDKITAIRNSYIDVDKDGDAALKKVATSTKVPKPSVVVQTSPDKYHVVWQVEGISPAEQESLNKALVADFGGDPSATDCTRILRLPGFANCKYAEKPVAHVVEESFAVFPYHRSEFKVELSETDNREGKRNSFVAPDAIREGDGRNDFILSFASSMRAKNFSDEAIRAAADAENKAKCKPPLDDAELNAVLNSALRPEYKQNDAEWRKAHQERQSSEPVIEQVTEPASWIEPMREEAFYGIAGDFVRLVEPETEADRHALLVNFLAMAGMQFGRNAYAIADGKKHYPNEFVLIVGESGAAGRKGTATERTMPLFHKVNDRFYDHVLSGLSSGEGLIKATEPREGDEPSSCRSYLVLLSEYASLLGVMKREGNTMSAVLRNAWDTAKLVVLTRKDPLKADNVNLSLVAHITPSELLNTLDATDRANGFANRHLIVAVRRSKLLPEGGHEINTEDIERLLHEAIAVSRNWDDGFDGEIKRDAEAKALWAEIYPHLTRTRPGLSGALLSRAEAHVLRLSLLYALLDASREIRVEHLKAALAVWEYCEASVGLIFGSTSGDPAGDKILSFMAECSDGFASPTDISVGVFHRNRDADWIRAKMGDLTRQGKIVAATRQSAKGELSGWKIVTKRRKAA